MYYAVYYAVMLCVQVPMLFGLSKEDALRDVKMGMWPRDLGQSMRRIRLAVADNENFRTAFGLLRISAASQEDLDEYARRQGGGSAFRSMRDLANPMSLANEERMLVQLADMCQDYLSRYLISSLKLMYSACMHFTDICCC